MSDLIRITPAEAHAKMTDDGYVYVDVRTPDEFAGGHPAGAVNVPLDDVFVATMETRFGKDAKIVVGCQGGVRSRKAGNALLAAGFSQLVEQRAGWGGARGPFGEIAEPGWRAAGLPSE